jgi:hypothetical protein
MPVAAGNAWPYMTGHIFKIKMIAVSFRVDIDTSSVSSARQFDGAAFDGEMIAQS